MPGTSLKLRTALVWAIIQAVVVIPYRRLGRTYRSHFQGLRNQEEKQSVKLNCGKRFNCPTNSRTTD